MARMVSVLIVLVVLSGGKVFAAGINQDSEIRIGIALSGGGVRAAAFAYGVMLELGEIYLCGETTKQIGRNRKEKDVIIKIQDLIAGPSDTCPYGLKKFKTPLLDNLHYISAVSGGNMPAAYFMSHSTEAFKKEFRAILRKQDFRFAVMSRLKTRSALGDTTLLSPLLMLTSTIDTVKHLVTFPFRWFLPDGFPLPNPDLTPLAFLGGARGLVNPEELASVYEEWFFNGKSINFGDIKAMRPDTELLVNATDIQNRMGFTFDEMTFECLGVQREDYRQFPISLATAASSSLPILFLPLDLKEKLRDIHSPQNIPKHCGDHFPLYGDLEKFSPYLLDGGISGNLGVGGLVKKIFREKNKENNANLKTFYIVVDAAAPTQGAVPSLGDDSTIPQNIDEGLDTLMRDKTDLVRTLFDQPINNLGISGMYFDFADLQEHSQIVKSIIHSKNNDLEDSFHATQAETKVINHLQSIGYTPTPNEVDALIFAGRLIVRHRIGEIKKRLQNLSEKIFQENCKKVINPYKEYCWPKKLTENKGFLERPLRVVLHGLNEMNETFQRTTTENRISAFSEFKKNILLNRQAWNKWDTHRLIIDFITDDEFLDKDRNFAHLYRDNQIAIAHDDFKDFKRNLVVRFKDFDFASLLLDNLRVLSLERNLHSREYAEKSVCEGYDARQQNDQARALKAWCRKVQALYNTVEGKFNETGSSVDLVPTAFMLQASLGRELGQYEDIFYWFYKGTRRSDKKLTGRLDVNLRQYLGYYLIIFERNLLSGLHQIQQAIDISTINEGSLSEKLKFFSREKYRRIFNGDYKELRNYLKSSRDRFASAREHLKTFYAFYAALSRESQEQETARNYGRDLRQQLEEGKVKDGAYQWIYFDLGLVEVLSTSEFICSQIDRRRNAEHNDKIAHAKNMFVLAEYYQMKEISKKLKNLNKHAFLKEIADSVFPKKSQQEIQKLEFGHFINKAKLSEYVDNFVYYFPSRLEEVTEENKSVNLPGMTNKKYMDSLDILTNVYDLELFRQAKQFSDKLGCFL